MGPQKMFCCRLTWVCLLFFSSAGSVILQAQQPATLLLPAARLYALKSASDAVTVQNIRQLRNVADRYLLFKAVSVMDKAFTPASGSRHDYMSQAPYFWYDSSKPNGLPYLRRDGQRNPEINRITDRKNLGDLENAASTLALAWFFSSREAYAQKAASLLRYWFIDTATKMNPNLDYGQGIPGINTGRGIGIIETIALMGIADAALLLETSAAWTKNDQLALKQWYRQYLQWMQTSTNGREEHAAKNNHGTWYYAQAIDFALYAGDKATADKMAAESKQLMEGQFTGDGKQPLELERTNALWYSTYNLQAWCRLATLAARTGTDLWHYTNSKQAGIRKAIDWLAPFALEQRSFPYQQIDHYNQQVFAELLLQAAKAYQDSGYGHIAQGVVTNALTYLLWNY